MSGDGWTFLVVVGLVVGIGSLGYVVYGHLRDAWARRDALAKLVRKQNTSRPKAEETAGQGMKVKELIEELEALEQDAEVILQEDAEGNCYRVLRGAAVALYYPYDGWHGECYDPDDQSAPRGAEPVVVLHPIN